VSTSMGSHSRLTSYQSLDHGPVHTVCRGAAFFRIRRRGTMLGFVGVAATRWSTPHALRIRSNSCGRVPTPKLTRSALSSAKNGGHEHAVGGG